MDAAFPTNNPPHERPVHFRPQVRVLLATAGWPSGILDVGSWAARQLGTEVVILRIDADDDAALIENLQNWRPHVVGFRVEGEPFEPIRRWIRAVGEFSDAEVVLGGPSATSHPVDLLEWSGADYVFAGEAEETFAHFLRLARHPDSRDLLPLIPGIAYRYGSGAYHNTLPADGFGQTVQETGSTDCVTPVPCLRNAIRPLASQGVVAANHLDWALLEGFKQPFDSLYFTGGRGCPGACSFCAKLHGTQVRIKSAGQLLEEIERADACVADGRLQVTRWPLFAHVDDDVFRRREVAWAAIYDEDFFLNVPRAIEFFELWSRSRLSERYRISLQTNPCSLLTKPGTFDSSKTGPYDAGQKSRMSPFLVHPGLLHWIDAVKPMVQLGAESFNPVLLGRWYKRHSLAQLNSVLDGLDSTHQDYTVFQLLTDYDTTAEELIETVRLLILAAFAHPRMRIASSAYTIPLYDSDTRKYLEFAGRLLQDRIQDFRDYERAHPEWMDPLVAGLADIADERLHWTLNPETRDGALLEVMPAVVQHLEEVSPGDCSQRDELLGQARSAEEEIRGAAYRPVSNRFEY